MCIMITPDDVDIDYTDKITFFLAGSIEMGNARRWQDYILNMVSRRKINTDKFVFFNPFKKHFDINIGNTIKDKDFNNQVSWEWDKLESSDYIIFNFEPDTKSPISLLELGAYCRSGNVKVVCCPPEFWKYGNVEFICDRYKIPLVKHLEDIINYV